MDKLNYMTLPEWGKHDVPLRNAHDNSGTEPNCVHG